MGGCAASGWRGMRHVRSVGQFLGRGVFRGNWRAGVRACGREHVSCVVRRARPDRAECTVRDDAHMMGAESRGRG